MAKPGNTLDLKKYTNNSNRDSYATRFFIIEKRKIMDKFTVAVGVVSMFDVQPSSDGSDSWTLVINLPQTPRTENDLDSRLEALDGPEYDKMSDKFSFLLNEDILGKDIRPMMDPEVLKEYFVSKKATEDIYDALEIQDWENQISLAEKNLNEGHKPIKTVGDLLSQITIQDFTLYLKNEEDKESLITWADLDWDENYFTEYSNRSIFDFFGEY